MFTNKGFLTFNAGSNPWFCVLVTAAAFAGAGLDLASWFLLKYYSEKWEYLSMAGGTLYSAAFAVMTIVILYDLYFRRESRV